MNFFSGSLQLLFLFLASSFSSHKIVVVNAFQLSSPFWLCRRDNTIQSLRAPSEQQRREGGGRRRCNNNNRNLIKTWMIDDMNTVLTQIDTFWINFPYQAGALICGVKASAADLIAQDIEKRQQATNVNVVGEITVTKNTSWNLERNMSFLLYGALYQGICQEYIFNHLYPLWFGTSTTDVTVIFMKVAFTITVQALFLTLPIAYVIKASMMKEQTIVKDGLQRYIMDLKHNGLLLKFWFIWGPTNTITFAFIPAHYRITFIAFISFFWLILLSEIVTNDGEGEVSLSSG